MGLEIRPLKPSEDAEAILRIHWAAVHQTAALDYPADLLDEWSPPIAQERVAAFIAGRDAEDEIMLIAESSGKIAGFGAVSIQNREIRAIYVSPELGGNGVGSALLKELETLAAQRGVRELHLDSSLTAAPFYRKHGYVDVEPAEHTLRSGRKMPCIRMNRVIDSL